MKDITQTNIIWKQFRDTIYEVSNTGQVRNTKTGCVRKLKPTVRGYYKTVITIDGKLKNFFIHRLVAEVFLGKSNLTVNHIDENKLNNNLSNLEYATVGENIRHSHCKKVVQMDKDNNVIETYKSIRDVVNYGFCKSSVCLCCKGKYKQYKGYKWKYLEVDKND